MELTIATPSIRSLKPASTLAATRDHGDRLKYMSGCRCDLCRRANTDYENTRSKARAAGDWNGIVSAEKSRKHIDWLSYHGVGRRQIAAATDVAESILVKIINGQRTNVRARTERLILAVTPDCAADHAIIAAGPTWKLINTLLKAGFTRSRIAAELGRKTHALQLGKTSITVRNAHDVQRLYERLIESDDVPVPGKPIWHLIKKLRDEGYTDKQLARDLNVAEAALTQRNAKVSKGFARRVEQFYERATT